MTKPLKQILFNIACLPSGDQTWILQRLSSTEMKTFKQCEGIKLLHEAQRFRGLKLEDVCFPVKEPLQPLPVFCQQLAIKSPLYAAIVIEQGSYSWKTLFLERFDKEGTIRSLMENQVMDVKPAVKQAVFNEWERSVDFESFLDDVGEETSCI